MVKKVEGHLVFLTLMSLWNNYLVPFIATAIMDPNCFYNAIVDARPGIETSVNVEVQITNSKSVLLSSNLEYVPGTHSPIYSLTYSPTHLLTHSLKGTLIAINALPLFYRHTYHSIFFTL